jgi:ATP-dependent DNA ligase
LNRFFPEVAVGLAKLKAERFVLDGELVIPGQSFETGPVSTGLSQSDSTSRIAGERTMQKYKVWHTVDAVLAGYYEDEATGSIDSLLFGLYADDGLLHFAGHSRVYDGAAEIAKLLDPLKGGTGFTGRSPGGKSRWTGKTQKLVRLNPVLVAELSADHTSGGQFRHGSQLLRWRTDKAPEDCKMRQFRR